MPAIRRKVLMFERGVDVQKSLDVDRIAFVSSIDASRTTGHDEVILEPVPALVVAGFPRVLVEVSLETMTASQSVCKGEYPAKLSSRIRVQVDGNAETIHGSWKAVHALE